MTESIIFENCIRENNKIIRELFLKHFARNRAFSTLTLIRPIKKHIAFVIVNVVVVGKIDGKSTRCDDACAKRTFACSRGFMRR